MIWTKIKDVFTSPGDRTTITGVRPGKATFMGTLRAGEEQLTSPVQGVPCLAFYYRATWKAKTRDNETTRVHRQAECYAPGFWIELADEPLWVVPKTNESFTRDDHLTILGAGIPGLEPGEQLVQTGDRVRLHGKLNRDNEQPFFELSRIDILEARPLETKSGNRAARRKAQREQRLAKKAKRR